MRVISLVVCIFAALMVQDVLSQPIGTGVGGTLLRFPLGGGLPFLPQLVPPIVPPFLPPPLVGPLFPPFLPFFRPFFGPRRFMFPFLPLGKRDTEQVMENEKFTEMLNNVNKKDTGVEVKSSEKVVETKPVETTPVETTPVETTPVETTPFETTPVENTPVEIKPVETTVETTSVETTPVEATPVEAKPVVVKPVVVKPVETKPVEIKTVEPTCRLSTEDLTLRCISEEKFECKLKSQTPDLKSTRLVLEDLTYLRKEHVYELVGRKSQITAVNPETKSDIIVSLWRGEQEKLSGFIFEDEKCWTQWESLVEKIKPEDFTFSLSIIPQ